MNYLATTALILSFGIPGYAQHVSANMRLSGTAAASAVDLGTGAPVSEYTLAGKGALGKFTLRVVSSGTTSPQQSTTCSGPNKLYFPILTGAAVFRFHDESLLNAAVTGGSDCIDLSAGHAQCIRIFQITGGTGRFKDASSNNLALTMVVTPVVPANPVFFFVTGEITGTVFKVAADNQSQDAAQ
jgi:hypothetical protein